MSETLPPADLPAALEGLARRVAASLASRRLSRQPAVDDAAGAPVPSPPAADDDDRSGRGLYPRVLAELLALTDSGYGCIGELRHDAPPGRRLQVFALADAEWDDATRAERLAACVDGIDGAWPGDDAADQPSADAPEAALPSADGDADADADADAAAAAAAAADTDTDTDADALGNTDADTAAGPRWHPRPGAAEGAAPLRNLLRLPLEHAGAAVGELLLGNRAAGYGAGWRQALAPLQRALAAYAAQRLSEHDDARAQAAAHDVAFLGARDALLRKLTQRVPGALYQFRRAPDGRMSMPYASDGLWELYELVPSDVARDAAALLDRIHADDRGWMRTVAEASARNLTPWRVEFRVVLPGRGVRWHAGDSQPERESDGSVLWTGYLKDVTEHKQAELGQREQAALLTKLTEHLPAVVFQYRRTPAGWESMPFATDGLRVVYGVLPEEVRDSARPLYLRVHEEDRPRLAASVAASAQTLQPWRLEFRVHAPDGALRWHEGHASPERTADGGSLWHGYIIDISQRKRYEEALMSAEAAQRANAAKTEFLSRMSHELRTPLNAVIGFAQLLQLDPTQPLTPLQHQRVAHVERAGQHLLEMINDVLDLSRIESGDLSLAMEAVPIGAVAAEAIALVVTEAQAAEVALRPPAAADAALVVRADRLRLRQVLVNLLSNACKYNRRGGHAELQARAVGEAVAIDVVDSGIGLSPAQLTHLWEPFNRLGAERSPVQGTGIGLPLSRRMVGLMDGRIDVASVPGEGSRFTVWLRAASASSGLAGLPSGLQERQGPASAEPTAPSG